MGNSNSTDIESGRQITGGQDWQKALKKILDKIVKAIDRRMETAETLDAKTIEWIKTNLSSFDTTPIEKEKDLAEYYTYGYKTLVKDITRALTYRYASEDNYNGLREIIAEFKTIYLEKPTLLELLDEAIALAQKHKDTHIPTAKAESTDPTLSFNPNLQTRAVEVPRYVETQFQIVKLLLPKLVIHQRLKN